MKPDNSEQSDYSHETQAGDRRGFLQKLATVGSVSGTGLAALSQPVKGESWRRVYQSPEFDPDSEREAHEFTAELQQMSDSEAHDTINDLSYEQQKALKGVVDGGSTSYATASGDNEFFATFVYDTKNTGKRIPFFSWTHLINWEYEDGETVDIDGTVYGDTHLPFLMYKEPTTTEYDRIVNDVGKSLRQLEFSGILPRVSPLSYYPSSELHGEGDGNGRVDSYTFDNPLPWADDSGSSENGGTIRYSDH